MGIGVTQDTPRDSDVDRVVLVNYKNFWNDKGAKYLVFVSSRSVKMRDSSTFSVCILFEESVFIFQFLNDKMHNYVKQNINVQSIIQKLKNKHTFLKKYTK